MSNLGFLVVNHICDFINLFSFKTISKDLPNTRLLVRNIKLALSTKGMTPKETHTAWCLVHFVSLCVLNFVLRIE